jgi:hypothetical protein
MEWTRKMTSSDLDAAQDGHSPYPVDAAAGAARATRLSAAAVAALVLGVAGFLLVTVPAGLVLSVVGLVRTRRHRRRGRGLAVAGLVLALVWSAGAGGLAAVIASRTGSVDRDAQGRVTKPAQVSPGDLRMGDCVDTSKTGELTTVPVTPCGSRRSGKVYAVLTLAPGGWPGRSTVDARAEAGCTTRYERAGKRATAPSRIAYFGPSELGWRLGDRSVVCVVERR